MKNILLTILFCLGIISIKSCTSEDPAETKQTENYDAGIDDDIISHELEKERLEKKELASPHTYLKLDAQTKRNLKGEWILKGTLENKATEATFENIKLNATYFDKEDNIVSTSTEVLNSAVNPNQTNELKFKLSQKPIKAKRVVAEIMDPNVK